MKRCDSFTIEMPELHSLKNTPRFCLTGRFGHPNKPMKYMDTLVGGPEIAKSITVFTEATWLNLETSLVQDVEMLTINAPSIAAFEGLNVNVTHLVLNTTDQHSFKGIHKALNNNTANICKFSIGVEKNYKGGVLPFAMLDPSIEVTADVAGNPPLDFTKSMEIVAEARNEGLNIHDIQERLIDCGMEQYARL